MRRPNEYPAFTIEQMATQIPPEAWGRLAHELPLILQHVKDTIESVDVLAPKLRDAAPAWLRILPLKFWQGMVRSGIVRATWVDDGKRTFTVRANVRAGDPAPYFSETVPMVPRGYCDDCKGEHDMDVCPICDGGSGNHSACFCPKDTYR